MILASECAELIERHDRVLKVFRKTRLPEPCCRILKDLMVVSFLVGTPRSELCRLSQTLIER
jgi:hypothetical protein